MQLADSGGLGEVVTGWSGESGPATMLGQRLGAPPPPTTAYAVSLSHEGSDGQLRTGVSGHFEAVTRTVVVADPGTLCVFLVWGEQTYRRRREPDTRHWLAW